MRASVLSPIFSDFLIDCPLAAKLKICDFVKGCFYYEKYFN
ncbi:MAG: hypothetical protein BWY12_00436 [candidate division BRC1 bacterium ADurb.Bin183]|nr:MAG: hypothetical protein BWY12_00436 [candidate division BRC1 bacterium ADurb.Bin183]